MSDHDYPSPPADERSPDFATCRNCGEPIAWDDVCYIHMDGWATCGTGRVDSGDKGPRWLRGALKSVGVTALVNPILTTDPSYNGATAQPLEWNADPERGWENLGTAWPPRTVQ